jgi:RNA polymerase sigma-70 factor (ECF subfamily)
VTDQFDDHQLAQALRTGEPDLLRAAVGRHFDAMSRLARALTGRSEADVDRLIAGVWVSAAADFPRAEPRGSARAWLFSRLFDACRAFLPADHEWEGHWAEFPVPWHGREDWEGSPEGRAVLARAIDSLPPPERNVLILRDLDGWSAAEVASLTQLPPGRQREVLFRARVSVRAAIDPMLREPAAAGPVGDAGHG